MSHHHKSSMCTLALEKNDKFKHNGAAAIAKVSRLSCDPFCATHPDAFVQAAHRYGFTSVQQGCE